MRHQRTPTYDAWTYATMGISTDLETQKRSRPWHERLPNRHDLLAGSLAAGALVSVFALTLYALSRIVP